MHAVGVNPADTYIRSGTYAFYTPQLPYTPGFDGAGIVDEVGTGVDTVKTGERVFVAALGTPGCSGTYAELAVIDAARSTRCRPPCPSARARRSASLA